MLKTYKHDNINALENNKINEIENLDNKTVGDIQRIEVLKRNIELLETGV